MRAQHMQGKDLGYMQWKVAPLRQVLDAIAPTGLLPGKKSKGYI